MRRYAATGTRGGVGRPLVRSEHHRRGGTDGIPGQGERLGRSSDGQGRRGDGWGPDLEVGGPVLPRPRSARLPGGDRTSSSGRRPSPPGGVCRHPGPRGPDGAELRHVAGRAAGTRNGRGFSAAPRCDGIGAAASRRYLDASPSSRCCRCRSASACACCSACRAERAHGTGVAASSPRWGSCAAATSDGVLNQGGPPIIGWALCLCRLP